MARRVFYSFHYDGDNWRVSQVRNMGVVEGQRILSANDWEDVADQGDAAIQAWIDEEMKGKSCNVVLIGSQTYGRKWVEYEFTKAWKDGRGVMGIYIHRLKDQNGYTSAKGLNPFSRFNINGTSFDSIVPVYDPGGYASTDVYDTIKNNIADWVEYAISVRGQW